MFFNAMPEQRILGIEIEKIVALQFEEGLWDLQLSCLRHRVWNMIELGRIVYGAEETRQIIEECIVATSDERFDRMAVGRGDGHYFVGIDGCRKATTGKIDKVHFRLAGLIDSDSDFRWLEFVKILIFDCIKIFNQRPQAMVPFGGRDDSQTGMTRNFVKHVRIEDSALRHRSKCSRRHDIFPSAIIISATSQHII